MNKLTITSIPILAMALTACSSHPLPEDFSRKNSSSIVHQIRCETREAIASYAVKILEQTARFSKDAAVIAAASNISKKLSNPDKHNYGYEEFENDIVYSDLDQNTREFILLYSLTGISYDFEFDITEKNNNDSNVSFTMPVPNGKFTLGLETKNNNTRQATRSIDIDENFTTLFANTRRQISPGHYADSCKGHTVKFDNKIYPISGKIGMDVVITTFVDIDHSVNSTRTFTDKLIYTTELEGKISPDLALTPLGSGLKLAKASGNTLSNRLDKHSLDITLKVPDQGEFEKLVERVNRARRRAREAGVSAEFTRSVRRLARKLAEDAAAAARRSREQKRYDRFLDRSSGGVLLVQ